MLSKAYDRAKAKKFIRALFWGATGVFLLKRGLGLTKWCDQIIRKVDLLKDGKHIIVSHTRYGYLQAETKVDIHDIKRSTSDFSVFALLAFPIMMKNDLFYLPKDKYEVDQAVFQAVLKN